MSTLAFPKGHTALLIMDCQNDIVHPKGKFGGDLTGGSMPQRIQDQNLLETIQKVAVQPAQHTYQSFMSGMRIGQIMPICQRTPRCMRACRNSRRLKTAPGEQIFMRH